MLQTEIRLRVPQVEDGTSISRLVRESNILDPNSTYCYLLLCKHFSETCSVAEVDGELFGFVTAYLPPGREDTFFLWQVGVSVGMRGRGIATCLIETSLRRDACRAVRFLETIVGPSNRASFALFSAVARRLNTELSQRPWLDAALFPEGNHEPENLLRIGPFQISPAG